MKTLRRKLFMMFSLSLALTLMTILSHIAFLEITHSLGKSSCSLPEASPTYQRPSPTVTEATATEPSRIKLIKKPTCSSDNLFLLIYVHSAAENVFNRYWLRRTWGSSKALKKLNASLVFIVGRTHVENTSAAISTEIELFNDIVLGDFPDTYRNMHLKALTGLEWVTRHCSKSRFLLKCDDDIFVDIFALVNYLVTEVDGKVGLGRGLLLCNYWDEKQRITPNRDNSNKWYISTEEYGKSEFPPFCQGAAYIISPDVASALFRKSAEVPPLWLDDVYVTGLLREAAGISATKLNAAFFANDAPMQTLMERIAQNKLLFVHGLSPQIFAKLWNVMMAMNWERIFGANTV